MNIKSNKTIKGGDNELSDFSKFVLSSIEHMKSREVKIRKINELLRNKIITSGWLGNWRCPVCQYVGNSYQFHWYDVGKLDTVQCSECRLNFTIDVIDVNKDEFYRYRILQIEE
jgi:hypothetical protein